MKKGRGGDTGRREEEMRRRRGREAQRGKRIEEEQRRKGKEEVILLVFFLCIAANITHIKLCLPFFLYRQNGLCIGWASDHLLTFITVPLDFDYDFVIAFAMSTGGFEYMPGSALYKVRLSCVLGERKADTKHHDIGRNQRLFVLSHRLL